MLDASALLYDQKASLELTVLSERAQDGTTIQDMTYASPRGGEVPANLIFPSQQAPGAGLILGHWGEGNRQEFVDEAVILARLGFVSLCLDAPFRRLQWSMCHRLQKSHLVIYSGLWTCAGESNC